MAVSKATEIERVVQAEAPHEAYADADLIREFIRGSEEAFNRLVLKHQQRAFNIALRFLGNPEDAEEVAQDAFVKAHRSLKLFRGEASFQTWLYKIILNLARNKHRRRMRRRGYQTVSLDAPRSYEEREAPREVPDERLSPQRYLGDREIQERIQTGLLALATEHRQVIILRHIEGLAYMEIAKILNCREGTVKSRLHRARKELRALLKDLL